MDQIVEGTPVIVGYSKPFNPMPCYSFKRDPRLQNASFNRKWYLLVIGLLYIGLLISFCLNIALIFRRPFNHEMLPGGSEVACKVQSLTQ